MSTRRTPKRRVLIITGSRSEYGLLKPVMEAVRKHTRLELRVAVGGEHLLGPAFTWKEVARDFRIDARVPMQRPEGRGRLDHAAACARGMTGFAAAFKKIKPDWVVVLGDRIEAFAAASAASIGGLAVCHIHGGDRAEGIADEAMRHAITKLAHLHCAATKLSAKRITSMGETPTRVIVTGSPAIDGLRGIEPLTDAEAASLGHSLDSGPQGPPVAVLLLHPCGLPPRQAAVHDDQVCFATFMTADEDAAVLSFAPNRDPGRASIEWLRRVYQRDHGWRLIDHLPRERFVALLKWMARRRVPLIGNSSAGLIECSALGVGVINVGPRQAGREAGRNATAVPDPGRGFMDIADRIRARGSARSNVFGDGRAGPRIAALLSKTDPHDPALLRKRNSY